MMTMTMITQLKEALEEGEFDDDDDATDDDDDMSGMRGLRQSMRIKRGMEVSLHA